MRGKQWEEPLCNRPAAPAGEPSGGAELVIQNLVYPRACGGTPPDGDTDASDAGLSPRLRGNRPRVSPGGSAARSIPAPAREPRLCRVAFPESQVYPRACGGTPSVLQLVHAGSGLSPRLRGNLHAEDRGRPPARSIPAPAGEPYALRYTPSTMRVYPRACGGTGQRLSTIESYGGLSPRLRGNRSVWSPL